MDLPDRGMQRLSGGSLEDEQRGDDLAYSIDFLFSTAVFCYPAVQAMENAG
jgi:hypothetical protein